MEFCSECKNLMVPKEVDSKKILVCRGCGREKKGYVKRDYKLIEEGAHKEAEVPVIEEEAKNNAEEKRKYNDDLYGYGEGSDFEN